MRLFSFAALLIVAASMQAGTARAQTWPSSPIHIITPGGPGGGYDTSARIISNGISSDLGQSVIVDNRPGALAGTIAAAHAPSDGYSLLLGGLSNIAFNVGLYPNLPYDPLRDFVPVGIPVSWSFTLVGRKDLPAHTLQELIAYAKLHPGALTYASTGAGTGQHIAMAVLAQMTGVQMQHVAYRSSAEAYQDILGGRVDLIFDNTTSAKGMIDADRVTAFAVSSASRQPFAPQIPTVLETGLAPFELETWFGLFARSGTAQPIVERLRQAMHKLTDDPETTKLVKGTSGNVLHMSDEDMRAMVNHDVEHWAKTIKSAGIVLDQ